MDLFNFSLCVFESIIDSVNQYFQVIILERRSSTGRVLYRSVTGGWNGSDDDKLRLHEQLDILQRDPSYLTHDAMLPELNNEFASVSHSAKQKDQGFV